MLGEGAAVGGKLREEDDEQHHGHHGTHQVERAPQTAQYFAMPFTPRGVHIEDVQQDDVLKAMVQRLYAQSDCPVGGLVAPDQPAEYDVLLGSREKPEG